MLGSTLKSLYNKDFYRWLQDTAQKLKDKKLEEIDWEDLIEEIEALGRSEKRAVVSNAVIVVMHLLKWKYEPQRQSESWLTSMREHRVRLAVDFETSPSLRRVYEDEFGKIYKLARREAARETGLDIMTFPEASPFSPEEVLDSGFLPNK